MEQVAAFQDMTGAGAGVFDSMLAALRGHKMTEEQAALCVQAYWRRYNSLIYFQESRGAAITVQAAFRGARSRGDIALKAEAAAKIGARVRGNFTREVTDYELVEFRAAAVLQAMWRLTLTLTLTLSLTLTWKEARSCSRLSTWRSGMHTPSSLWLEPGLGLGLGLGFLP